jgi:hypothetical protein
MESKCMQMVAVVAYFEIPLLYFPKMLEQDHENSDSKYLVCLPNLKHGTFRIQYKLTMILVQFLCFWILSIRLVGFKLKTETEFSLRNIVF